MGLSTSARRHDFARLAPSALAGCEVMPEVREWCRRGLPFAVTRQVDGTDRGHLLRLGLALPDKRRISFTVAREAIVALQSPPLLAETLDSTPAGWLARLREIERIGRSHDIEVRVFGSLAWQHLTKLEYVRPTSDVDLLLSARTYERAERFAGSLSMMSGSPRLDGEIGFADGSGVAWRESLGPNELVLMKGAEVVCLRSRSELRSRFATMAP